MEQTQDPAENPAAADGFGRGRAGLGLPRASHLLRKADFDRVYRQGARARGRFILVVAAAGMQPGTARMGLSVSRRYSRSAVVRNRARRCLREAFRLVRAELPHLDLVLSPLVSGRRCGTRELRDELVTLLGRIERKLELR
ncbi:MAG TPA: ribonuclease P protein component [Planctomycetota bacterium]